MMLRRCLALVLATSLLPMLTLPAAAGSQAVAGAEETAKVKASIASRGRGRDATVTIGMRDGTKLKGYISDAGEKSFRLTDAKTRQTTTIAYGDVVKVDKGRSELTKLFIFMGATVGILTAVMAIALIAADPH
jgi:hypothetical protein